jgi:hypothetical protein
MSTDYIRHFGMSDSGYAEIDKEAANELVIRMLTINDMVTHYFSKGAPVRVSSIADTKIIYEYITDHLNAWKEKLEQGWHTRDAPIEDLILLDAFAMKVYQYAVHQFTTEIVDSLIARRLSSTLKVNRDNILKPKAVTTVTVNAIGEETEVEDTTPKRESMADVFAQKRVSTNAGWR